MANAYKGDSAGYAAKHLWVRAHFGKPIPCEDCGRRKIPKGFKRYFDWANVSGQYKRVRSDWKKLCKKCHASMDIRLKPRGERQGSSKMTWKNVNAIRSLKAENPGIPCHKIAKDYGVAESTIIRIVNGKSWKSMTVNP